MRREIRKGSTHEMIASPKKMLPGNRNSRRQAATFFWKPAIARKTEAQQGKTEKKAA